MQSTMAVPVFLGLRYLPVRFAGSFADSATGTGSRPGQSRNGSRPAWPSFWELGRRADSPRRARRELRFSVCQRFSLEYQERAERAFCQLEQIPGNGGHRLSALTGQQGLYFHATALWQGGGNLGTYLGLLTSPSGMSSANTCRLDSWWIEKRWLDERITARVGQFAGQDFYGAQHYAASFIFEPMGYALGNLFTTLEMFDPPSTPAMEVRVVPTHNLFVKSMVMAAVPNRSSQNPTGLVPQFNGVPDECLRDWIYAGAKGFVRARL